MTVKLVSSNQPPAELECCGVSRDKQDGLMLRVRFNRPVTDAELRFLHEVMERSAVLADLQNE